MTFFDISNDRRPILMIFLWFCAINISIYMCNINRAKSQKKNKNRDWNKLFAPKLKKSNFLWFFCSWDRSCSTTPKPNWAYSCDYLVEVVTIISLSQLCLKNRNIFAKKNHILTTILLDFIESRNFWYGSTHLHKASQNISKVAPPNWI